MNTGAALAIAGGAILLVLYLNRQSEQTTAMRASAIKAQINSGGLTFGDLLAVGTVAGATAVGGPAAGLKAYGATGIRL